MFFCLFSITLDILAALRYCHSQHVLHLDVKPPNVLVALGTKSTGAGNLYNRSYICKLCDFGSSIKLDDESCANPKHSAKGTLRYMSPEALRSATLSCASDIYSLGITMWQLQARRLPFHTLTCNESIAYQVVKHDLRPDNYTLLEQLRLGTAGQVPGVPPISNCNCGERGLSIRYNSVDLLRSYVNKLEPQLEAILSSDMYKKANMLALRNLNFENNTGRVQKRPKRQRKQPRLAHYFENLSPPGLSTCLESAYSELYKSCWLSQPELRLNAFQLQQSLETILIKCFPNK